MKMSIESFKSYIGRSSVRSVAESGGAATVLLGRGVRAVRNQAYNRRI